jgi:hypothetical protein
LWDYGFDHGSGVIRRIFKATMLTCSAFTTRLVMPGRKIDKTGKPLVMVFAARENGAMSILFLSIPSDSCHFSFGEMKVVHDVID